MFKILNRISNQASRKHSGIRSPPASMLYVGCKLGGRHFNTQHSMEFRIQLLQEKKIIGKSDIMSFANNKARQLWQSFMPSKNLIPNINDTDLYSIEVYPPDFFNNFKPTNEFRKWAGVEVTDISLIPDGMEPITIPNGLYAVFLHKGPASDGPKTYHYIFNDWFPTSGYKVDDRPHFALMGEKYKNDDPNSEEEIWIPIVPK